MLKQYLVAFMLFFPILVQADPVKIGNISYNLIATGKMSIAEVVSSDDVSEIIVPETVEYEGVTFTIKKVCSNAFAGHILLASVKLPETVSEIGDDVFSGCKNLTFANIPNGVHILGIGCFYGCISLKEIIIPNSVVDIGFSCFDFCI